MCQGKGLDGILWLVQDMGGRGFYLAWIIEKLLRLRYGTCGSACAEPYKVDAIQAGKRSESLWDNRAERGLLENHLYLDI